MKDAFKKAPMIMNMETKGTVETAKWHIDENFDENFEEVDVVMNYFTSCRMDQHLLIDEDDTMASGVVLSSNEQWISGSIVGTCGLSILATEYRSVKHSLAQPASQLQPECSPSAKSTIKSTQMSIARCYIRSNFAGFGTKPCKGKQSHQCM